MSTPQTAHQLVQARAKLDQALNHVMALTVIPLVFCSEDGPLKQAEKELVNAHLREAQRALQSFEEAARGS